MMKEEIPRADQIPFSELIHYLMNKALNKGTAEHWNPDVDPWIPGSKDHQHLKKHSKSAARSHERDKASEQGESWEQAAHEDRMPQAQMFRATNDHTSLRDFGPYQLKSAALERSHSPNSLFDDAESPVRTRENQGKDQNGQVSVELARRILDLPRSYANDEQ